MLGCQAPESAMLWLRHEAHPLSAAAQFFVLLRPHAQIVAYEKKIFKAFEESCVTKWIAKTKCEQSDNAIVRLISRAKHAH